MPKPCTWVVKLGGSLLHDASFVRWLLACTAASPTRCVVVVGGGRAADEVRALHARWCFEESLAHLLAITAMRSNALIAQALVPSLRGFAQDLPTDEAAALWLPEDDCAWLGVPASWAVTSDSLAVALAAAIGAEAVCLVKSRPGMDAPAASVVACAADGLVDAYLPALMQRKAVPVFALARLAIGDFIRARASGIPVGMRLLEGRLASSTDDLTAKGQPQGSR